MFDKTKAWMTHMQETGICLGYIASFVTADKSETITSGYKRIQPNHEVMTLNSQFDIASLTKVVGTTTVIFQLLADGGLHLDDKVQDYLPIQSSDLTIRHLLTHTSDFQGYIVGRNDLDAKPLAEALLSEMNPGEQLGKVVKYSDINFLYLGWIVEVITHQSIQSVIKERVIEPMGLLDTTTTPDTRRVVPTEDDKQRGLICGTVHDPKTYKLKAHSGSAGLFSTINDLTTFIRLYFNGGKTQDGTIIIQPEIIEALSQSYTKPDMRPYSLGWNLEKVGHHDALTHTGYTGTYLFIDLEKEQGFIFLSNRIHPEDKRDEYIAARDEMIRIFVKELEEQ